MRCDTCGQYLGFLLVGNCKKCKDEIFKKNMKHCIDGKRHKFIIKFETEKNRYGDKYTIKRILCKNINCTLNEKIYL